MPVASKDIWIFGAANHPESDVGTVGGAVDTGTKMTFSNPSSVSSFKVYSSYADDITQAVTLVGYNAGGSIVSETVSLNDQNGLTGSNATNASFAQLLKGVLSAESGTTVACIAAISQETAVTGTAQAAGDDYLTLAADAITSDGLYKHWVLRITGGSTGVGAIAEIIDSTTADDKVYIRQWCGTTPTGTITYSIAPGMVFEEYTTPAVKIDTVCCPFYDSTIPTSGTRYYYAKIFVSNKHASTSLTNATIAELATGIYADMSFGVESSVNGSDTSTDRLTAPTGYTFVASSATTIGSSGTLAAGSAQGIWLKLSVPYTALAQKSFINHKIAGQST